MSDSLRPHRRRPTRLPHPWDSPGKNTGVGCHFLLQCMKVKSESEVTQSCLTPNDPMDYSLPGSSVPGIFQARALEWGAIAFSVPWPWSPNSRVKQQHSLYFSHSQGTASSYTHGPLPELSMFSRHLRSVICHRPELTRVNCFYHRPELTCVKCLHSPETGAHVCELSSRSAGRSSPWKRGC